MHVPDGTVWTGRYPVAPTGMGRGSLPTAVFARRFDRIF
jgi:hypothetical protein